MKLHGWSGRWPTDEFPPDGTVLRYHWRLTELRVSRVVRVWCGVEPVFNMENGDRVFPTLEPYEEVTE